MEKLLRADLYRSMQDFINERIASLDSRTERARVKLKSPKASEISKMSSKGAIKDSNERKKKFAILSKALRCLYFAPVTEIVSLYNFNDISSYLSAEEVAELSFLVNEAVNRIGKREKGYAKHCAKNVRKVLRELGLENASFPVHDSISGEDKGESVTFDSALNAMVEELEERLSTFDVKITPDENFPALSSSDEKMFGEISELISSGELGDIDIEMNFSEIKEVYEKRSRANHLVLVLPGLIADLAKSIDFDYRSIIAYLEQILRSNREVVRNSNEFLRKFDLDRAKDLAQQKNKEKVDENLRNKGLAEYTSLAYQLASLESEDPDNVEKIQEIQSKMQDCARVHGLDESALAKATLAGQEMYRSDASKQEFDREVRAIYGEYERYKAAALESGAEVISFSEYAKIYHGLDMANISEKDGMVLKLT